MPTIDEIQTQLTDLQDKALTFVKDAQAPVVDYVAKAADTVATRLPEERPELVTKGIDALVQQVEFAKTVVDTEVAFAKAVVDAALKPFTPAKVKRTVKAA